jgi:hypothetical protein
LQGDAAGTAGFTADGEWRMVEDSSFMADGEWRMADGEGRFAVFAVRRGAASFFRAFAGLVFFLPVTGHRSRVIEVSGRA